MPDAITERPEPTMRRWTDQRWMIDNAVRAQGVEFDQARMNHVLIAVGAEVSADLAEIKARSQKFADIVGAFESIARRRQDRAEAAEAAGYRVTARDNWFIASLFWGFASWPILTVNAQNLRVNQSKHDCYARYAALADHKVQAVRIPFQGRHLNAWLHLPPGTEGQKVPVVIALSGMDGFKEFIVALNGDRFLARGMAVLALDGPGQYDSVLDGIHFSVPAWAAAGTAVVDWLETRPEIDATKIGFTGRSFGSFYATIAVANEPRIAACAVTGTCLEPGGHAIFEEACPTYKRRFMYNAGYIDEAAFDRFRQTITWEGHAEKIRGPYLCVSGEFDKLSPLHHTERMFATMSGPRQLMVYKGADHGVAGVASTNQGPYFPAYLADWMQDRLAGKPMDSERWDIDGAGRITRTPY